MAMVGSGERDEGRWRRRQRCGGDGTGPACGAVEGGHREGEGDEAVVAAKSGEGGRGIDGDGGLRRGGRMQWERWVEGTAWPLVGGAAAGMASKLAVFPLDTVKKRVQTEVTPNMNSGSGK